MARPIKYTRDAKLAIIEEYDGLPKGSRESVALGIGVSFKSLMIYISKWKRELFTKEIEDDPQNENLEEDT